MEGWIVRRHGGLEALEWSDHLPTPEPGPGQVRLRVRAVGLNHLDVWVRKGVPGHRFPLPLIPGCDMAGTVDKVGVGVDQIDPEARFIVDPGLSCGACPACDTGQHPLCRGYGIFGETTHGGAAEYAVVPRANLLEAPPQLSWAEAASFPLAFLTAWHMVVTRAQVRPGQTVLVQAAASGVSAAAIQIAALLGARVFAAARGEAKTAFARSLGAEAAIDTASEDLVARVRELAGKGGVDLIVDHMGAATWEQDLKVLARGGTLVTCGATTGADAAINLRALFFKAWSILGSTMGSRGELRTVTELFRQGRLRPVLDAALPLSELREAHRMLEAREVLGKLVCLHP
ncbi:MAG: zinc-binding dehydrogenase [Deltaproteobacteria bacterium]|nr:zinc-binding dehydrogenase [Deltaproteobacteria bacterium]